MSAAVLRVEHIQEFANLTILQSAVIDWFLQNQALNGPFGPAHVVTGADGGFEWKRAGQDHPAISRWVLDSFASFRLARDD